MEYIYALKHGDLVHRCFRCGYCKFPSDYVDFNCPSYKALGFDTFSSAGRMWLIRAWLNNEIKTSTHFAEILFSCVACASCMEQCVYPGFKDSLLDIFQEAKEQLVNEGIVPPKVRDYFKAILINGNPYKLPQEERDRWAQGTNVQPFNDHEYLFYIGCVGSYDEVGMKMARSVSTLLSRLGVSFGILGKEETCDGNEVNILGESGLFDSVAHKTIRKFNEKGIKKIITLDPHALNVFKKEYPRMGGNFEIFHYTEVLAPIIKRKKISPPPHEIKVTYHDACYLGRHNGIYRPPREILKSIPGLKLVEMRRNRTNAFCCGGGGGNFFTDILGSGEDSPARVRIREALATGADLLAVSCPNCARMLLEAAKTEAADNKIKVADIAEIFNMCWGLENMR